MKKVFLSLASFIILSSKIAASTILYIGINNNSNSEFEQEAGGRNDNKYYWHIGDYSAINAIGGGTGINWEGDNDNPAGATSYERWSDGSGASTPLGFARAITNGFTTNNIFFKFDADHVGAGKSLQFEIDFIGPGFGSDATESRHDVRFFLNGVEFLTVNSINSARLVSATIDATNLTAGESVLSWQRVGGASGGNWISIDYVSLVSVPEPSRTVLMMAALGLFIVRRRR